MIESSHDRSAGDRDGWIDLTLPVRDGMRGVEFSPSHSVQRDGWNAQTLHLYSHSGTHMDAPVHFGVTPSSPTAARTIDAFDLDRFMVRAHVVELFDLADRQPITVEHLGSIAAAVRPGDGILLATRWSDRLDDPQDYRDNFSPISVELGRWMVQRKVGLVGVEAPSVGDVNDLSAVTEIHHVLLGGDVVIVEGLTNLDRLGSRLCELVALPLKIQDGDGCPCRAIARPIEPS